MNGQQSPVRGTLATIVLGFAVIVVACGGAGPTASAPAASQGVSVSAQPRMSPAAVSLPPSQVSLRPSAAAGPSAPIGQAVGPGLTIVARDARLVGPTGLLFDAKGNLYVSDCSWMQSYIHRITPDGMLTTIAGVGDTKFAGDGGPATEANLQCPTGMAWGPDGTLYFADHASNRIRHIDRNGIITTVAGSGPAGVNAGSFSGDGGPAIEATLQEPWSIAFDIAGNLFISDRDNYRIRRVDLDGVITTVAGTGRLSFDADGGPATAAPICPLGIAIDGAGNLLIADVCNYRIRSVNSHGVINTIAGTGSFFFSGDGGPAMAAGLERPGHLAFDAQGGLFVQDGLRIRYINADGAITTIAGTGHAGVPTDGMAANEAQFPDMYGIAVDEAGNIYLADNTSVYRIDWPGIVTRFAGAR